MIVNLMWAAVPALLSLGAGLSLWQSAFVWWVAFRAEFAYDALAGVARVQHARGINESALQTVIGEKLMEKP